MKKVYGKDRRIDVATVSISEENRILDKHLIDCLLECIYVVMENDGETPLSEQSTLCVS